MSNVHGITVDNLMSTLPEFLRRDEKVSAVAEAISIKMAELPEMIDSIQIYALIDDLPEPLLDILAYDYKVDWWDPNYPIDVKRQTLKDSWHVHRTLGTKHAVETAISAVYSETFISEWFQYGGPPFEFLLHIDATYEDVDPVKHQRVLDRLEFYKNLRSSPYYIEYTARPFGDNIAYTGTALTCLSGEITMKVEVDMNDLE